MTHVATAPILPVRVLDEEETVDAVRCEPLRISYADPVDHEILCEDVYLDPRDAFRSGNNLLLVGAAAVETMQKKLDREGRWSRESRATLEKCRRDYLREQRYLLEELKEINESLKEPLARREVFEYMDGAMEMSERAAEDATKVVSRDEAELVAASVGPKYTPGEDDDLVRWLEKVGINTSDDLLLRMLLKRFRPAMAGPLAERDRLIKILNTMEGDANGSQVVDSLIAAAEVANVGIDEVVKALLDHQAAGEIRERLEVMVTRNLRVRYTELLKKRDHVEPKVQSWREMLGTQAQREMRVSELEAELEGAEMRWREKEAEMEEGKEDDSIPADIWDRLPNWRKEAIRKTEQAVKDVEAEMKGELSAMRTLEQEVATYHEKTKRFTLRHEDSAEQCASFEGEVNEAEERFRAAEEEETREEAEAARVAEQKQFVEDEHTACLAPPVKEREFHRIEQEVADSRLKNQELRAEEACLYAKEREYERRYKNCELVWKAQEAEAAAEEAARKEALAEAAAAALKAKKHDPNGDPMLLGYHERIGLSGEDRYISLHTDARARARRLRKEMIEFESEEAAAIAARAEASKQTGGQAAAPFQVPVWFRRPEDLRVRLAGAEQTIGILSRGLAASGARHAELVEEMRGLTKQLGAGAADGIRLHEEARSSLVALFAERSELPPDATREDLRRALERHQACMARADESWRQAEHSIARGLAETELVLEEDECTRREEELTASARDLYTTALLASEDGPEAIAAATRRCCSDWVAVEPRLIAAATARGTVWPRAFFASGRLLKEKANRDGLQGLLRAEETKRNLLDAEIIAPPEAKRALAAMRQAFATASRAESPPLHGQSAALDGVPPSWSILE